jgi:energy-coupling factor transporter ATP-binding protein EcfA2
MRIRSLEINGLFGMFNYLVPMKLEDRITILHGPNGFGKTTILRLVNSLFRGRYAEMRRIPFDTFRVDLEDGRSLKVTKRSPETSVSKDPRKRKLSSLSIQLLEGTEEINHSELGPVSRDNLQYPVEYISQWIPALVRIRPDTWRYTPTGEEWALEELLEEFGEVIPYPVPEARTEDEWLHRFRDTVKVRFIESQRLLRVVKLARPGEQPSSMEPSVAFYAGQLAKAIQETYSKYTALSQDLDRSFPVRLVEQMQAGPQLRGEVAVDQLRQKLKELENKREQLRAAGLLDKQEDYRFQVPLQLEETTQKVLPVYVRDVGQKLDVFNENR